MRVVSIAYTRASFWLKGRDAYVASFELICPDFLCGCFWQYGSLCLHPRQLRILASFERSSTQRQDKLE
jgi:hypothetical protein